MKKSIVKMMAEAAKAAEAEKKAEASAPAAQPASARQSAPQSSAPSAPAVGRADGGACRQLHGPRPVAAEGRQHRCAGPGQDRPFPFRDRFAADEEAAEALEELKLSISSEGQKIPVLVRPHPAAEGRYQLAYGHRRLAAVLALMQESGRPEAVKIRAYVRPLSDMDLIREQSLENGVRENLTWIEQALWAQQLKEAGFKQRDMQPVLGVTESTVSTPAEGGGERSGGHCSGHRPGAQCRPPGLDGLCEAVRRRQGCPAHPRRSGQQGLSCGRCARAHEPCGKGRARQGR
ncbi:ParB/RepB/Spo0J family partition protein [Pannonibacter sp. Pt2-lr]